MESGALNDKVIKYFALLDEKRAWNKRSPFPKQKELEVAEYALRMFSSTAIRDDVQRVEKAHSGAESIADEKNKIEKALSVMVLDRSIRGWLRNNDPKALAQAFDALNAEGSSALRDALVDARREHCKGDACFLHSRCECQCGKCTARYGSDGVWR